MTEKISSDYSILNVDLESQMKKSYLDYSMSVIVARALPDVRDGLKPVHRRILYGMSLLGLTPDKPYRKSARLVGDVMGRFHPHGDTAIYDAVVRLAQPFNTRYPLADGQGNFGSIDGDSAAAMRYTEVRMTKLAQEMLRDINKDTVDFQPNFDEEELEPKILPSRFPNLLVNGSSGIAVGMATNMAPHNLGEVIDGCVAYMDNEDISLEELMKYIPGPDFPTAGNIMGTREIENAYATGRGRIKLRAVCTIEEVKNRHRIVVREIPYQVNKANLIRKIADLVKDKRLEGISDIRDDSNRTGIRIIIDLKRDAIPKVVLNNLYSLTPLETTFGIINLALVDNQPRILGLKDLISHYVSHQKDVVTRRTQFDLNKAEKRAHVVEGLRIAIDHIDEIIRIIRTSYNDEEIKNTFLKKFGLDEVQTQAILDMRLKRLSGLEREKLDDEYKELIQQIARFKEILANPRVLINVIKDELTEIKNKYADKRRTKILPAADEIKIEDLIQEDQVIVTLTKKGYIKRIPVDTYKVQNRGGKGIRGLSTKEDDYVDSFHVVSTHDQLLFFTNQGNVYSLKAYEIQEGKRTSKGQAIVNLLTLSKDEYVTAMFPFNSISEDHYLLMATKCGYVKKTSTQHFKTIRSSGIRAMTLRDEDELIAVRITSNEDEIFMVTKHGQASRFSLANIRPLGRSGMGVIGMRLDPDDNIISMDIVDPNQYLFVASENGYGKKTKLSNYPLRNRGIKGVKTYKITKKTGNLVSAMLVTKEDEVLLISQAGDIIRLKVSGISTLNRDTQGVKLKDVKTDGDRIVAVAKYIESDEE